MTAPVHGETVAECFYEIVARGPHAEDALVLLLGEIRGTNVLPQVVHAKLIAALEQIETGRLFGRNTLTDRVREILADRPEFREAFAGIFAELLLGTRP